MSFFPLLSVLLVFVLTACAGTPEVVAARPSWQALPQAANDYDPAPGEPALQTAERIRRAIAALPGLSAYDVRIETVGDVATLKGTVQREEDRSAIAAAARATSGVRTVEDLITLRRVDDVTLRKLVLQSLRNEPDVDLRGVDISVRGGVVVVSGSVSDHRVIDRILSNVLMVPGVKNIESDVTITGKSA